MRDSWFVLASCLIMTVTVGCRDDGTRGGWEVTEGEGDETPYGDDSAVVITPGDDTVVIVGSGGDGCAELRGDVCINPDDVRSDYCGDDAAQADVILDEDGEVVEVICYPPADDGTPIEEVETDAEGNAEVPQTENGAVIVFSDDTDGEAIEGNVNLTAERVTLYGNGVDVTILDGNLEFSSNNAAARGITVTGNVTIDRISNNSSITFCKIHGNLESNASNTTVANCQVFGNVSVSGNDATLVNIGVQGDWNVHESAYCNGCYSFDDADGDFGVADDERRDALTCGS